jgi:hypothetical protein
VIGLMKLLVPPSRWELVGDFLAFLESGAAKRPIVTRDSWTVLPDVWAALPNRAALARFDSAASSWPTLIDEFVEWAAARA